MLSNRIDLIAAQKKNMFLKFFFKAFENYENFSNAYFFYKSNIFFHSTRQGNLALKKLKKKSLNKYVQLIAIIMWTII